MAKQIKIAVVSYVVDLECDCGGKMEWDGFVLTSNPPQYKHQCLTCGKVETLLIRAGNLVHERAPD